MALKQEGVHFFQCPKQGTLYKYPTPPGSLWLCVPRPTLLSERLAQANHWHTADFLQRSEHFGKGTKDFWLDDVRCSGYENSIEECSHREWGHHNCRDINPAGVMCKLHSNDMIAKPKNSEASGKVICQLLIIWFYRLSFSFEGDDDVYEYKIFSIVSSTRAWTSVILAGKCDNPSSF